MHAVHRHAGARHARRTSRRRSGTLSMCSRCGASSLGGAERVVSSMPSRWSSGPGPNGVGARGRRLRPTRLDAPPARATGSRPRRTSSFPAESSSERAPMRGMRDGVLGACGRRRTERPAGVDGSAVHSAGGRICCRGCQWREGRKVCPWGCSGGKGRWTSWARSASRCPVWPPRRHWCDARSASASRSPVW